MKFINFLNEKVDDDKINELKINCKKFLDMTTVKFPLLRGIDFDIKKNEVNLLKVNKNRPPVNIGKKLDRIINNAFFSVFNIKVRSSCVFCINDVEIVKSYGKLFYIIPKGNFEVFWSNKINDFFIMNDWIVFDKNEIKNKNDAYIALFEIVILKASERDFILYNKILEKNSKLFGKYFKNFKDYENKKLDLIDFLNSHFEEAQKIWINFMYQKGNLQEAIKSKNEIMLVCDEYYAVNETIWKKLFSK